jgi:hypothetical protein
MSALHWYYSRCACCLPTWSPGSLLDSTLSTSRLLPRVFIWIKAIAHLVSLFLKLSCSISSNHDWIDVDQRYRAYFHHSESRTIRHYSAAEVDDMGWAPVWPVSFICTTFRHSAERVRLTGGIEGQNTMTQIITTTDPQPNFSAEHSTNIPLYSTASLYMYTLLEYNRFHASEPATSLVWYSRTLRIRRGPSTNICTPNKIPEQP